MKTKHTPGPWYKSEKMGTEHLKGYEPWFYVSADRTLHLQVSACPDGYVIGENEANARLIAAAPDLLDALQAIVGPSNDDPRGFVVLPSQLIKAWESIAKATGEQ